jgi:hypothetical protein
MFKPAQGSECQLKNIVAVPTIDAGNKTNTACIVLEARVVQLGRVSRRKVHCSFLGFY